MKHLGKTLTLCSGLVALPAGGQETGGKTTRFEVLQQFEAARNPDLNPGEDGTETLSLTTVAYELRNKTRRDDLSLRLQTSLRLPLSGSDDDAELDDSRAVLRYVHTAPGTQLSAYGSLHSRELAHLNALDLVDDDSVNDDISDFSSTGTRISSTIRLGGQFREDRPFGWGWTLGAGKVRYSDLSAGSTLEDSDSVNAALNGRFDLNPVLQMTSRLRYSRSDEENSPRTITRGADFGLVFSQPASELRSALSLEWPNQSTDRVALTFGGTRQLNDRGEISLDMGSSFIDGGSTYLIGQLDYRQQLSNTNLLRARLDREVRDASDGSVLLRTVGQLGYGVALTPLTDFNFDMRYLDRDTLDSSDELQEYSLVASLDHQITQDWSLIAGVSHTTRKENGNADATSESVFFTLKRVWDGGF